MGLGKRVRELRKAKGLSQVKLAKLAGIDQTTISLIETGHTPNATARVLSALAQLLGVSVDYLVSGEKKPDKTMLRQEIIELAYKLQSLSPDKVEIIVATVNALHGTAAPAAIPPPIVHKDKH